MKYLLPDTYLNNGKTDYFQETISLLINHLDISFILIDRGLNVILFNEMARKDMQELLGLDLKEKTNILIYAPHERREALKELYNEVFHGNEKKSETEIVLKNGDIRYFENTFKPALNKDNEVVCVVVLSREITHIKKAELHLKESEERWRFALEGANQGAWDWNMQTNEIIYSPGYKKIYGFKDDDLPNSIEEWESRIHPDDRERIKKDVENHLKSTIPVYESIYRLKNRYGAIRWILARGMLVSRDLEGRPLRMIGTHTDITERKQVEENYKMLFYSNPLPMWTYDKKTLRITDVNDAAVWHYGYSREEFLFLTIKDIRPEEEFDKFIEMIKNRPNGGFSKSKVRHRKKNGEIIYVEVSTNILQANNKDEVLVLANDITQNVKAEEALIKSNERFSYAAKATSEALWEWDLVTGEFYMSQTYTDLFGWQVNKNKIIDDWHKYIHPEDKQGTIDNFHTTIQDHLQDHWFKEYRYLKSDGSYAIVMDNAIVLRNEERKAIKVIGAIKDITNQKRVEKELKKSNERFMIAGRASSDALYEWDVFSNDIYWGEGMLDLFGFHPKEVTMDTWEGLIHKDDVTRVMDSLNAALFHSIKKFWKAEYRFSRADGTYRYVLDRGYIIRNEEGAAVQMIGSIQDISDRKYNEQLLSLERSIFELSTNPSLELGYIIEHLLKGFEEIHEDACTSVLLLKEDATIASLSGPKMPPSFSEKLSGIKPGMNDGSFGAAMHFKKTIIVEDIDADELWENYKDVAMQHDLKACWSLPVIHTSGWIMGCFSVYYKQKKAPNSSELNTLERIRNILRTLMEQYWSLNEIRVANERFDIMMKATHDLIWDWNLETNEIFREGKGLKKVYGLDDNEQIKHVFQWIHRIHEDDQAKVQKVISEILGSEEQDTFDVEYRFLREDGTYSYVYDRGIIIRNGAGKPYRMIGAAQDITIRKKLEQELIKTELERQKAINQATIDTQEQERSEIGKELHDNVNQVLTTTKLYLDLALGNAELKDELIQKSTKNIVNVINEIRQLSRSLMDPSIGDLGLMDSILDLAENINLTRKLQVHLTADQKIESLLNKNQKLTVFRIIQEALNNAVKHASATIVSIHIMQLNNETAEIMIVDDGVGFQPESVKKGAGLKNIQNRIYLINGSIAIYSSPDNGCKLIIKFPLK